MSPESEQAKAIALVRALQKLINLCPNRMFKVIEIFQHDEVLHKTGRETWTEIGVIQYNKIQFRSNHKVIFQQESWSIEYQPLCLVLNYIPPPGNQTTYQGKFQLDFMYNYTIIVILICRE